MAARCVAYTRVSTERQATEVATSLEEQAAQLERLAARFGVSVERWYRDEGASGASVEARPAFRQLLADCAAAPCGDVPGLVLVFDDSRWGRFPNPDEAAYWRHHLHQLGWIVRFAVGDDVEDIGFRHILRAIGGAQSSKERATIRRRARDGRRGSAMQGFWTGRAPIGYRRQVVYPTGSERILEDGQQKASSERVKLIPHPAEAELVRWAFERYASGEQTLQGLARALAERRPDRRWSKTVVQHLLRNPAYMGDVVGGRRPADRNERLTLGHVRPAAEWYAKRDAHEAIVPRELYAAVQARLAGNRRLGRGVKADYLLTGVLRCSRCGVHYHGGGHSALQRRGRPALVRFYKEAAPCGGHTGTVSRHIIDDTAVAEIARVVRRPTMATRIKAEIDRQLSTERPAVRLRDVAQERRRLIQQRDRLISAIAAGTVSQDEAAGAIERIRTQLEATDQSEHVARFAARRAVHGPDRDRLVALALDFPRVVARLHGPALRDLVQAWLAGATFDKATRELMLQIRPVPGYVLASLPGRDIPQQARLIRRRVLLAPPGWDARQAAADLARRGA